MTRDLDRFEEQALCKLTSLMVTHGPVPVRALRRRQRVHLDIDTTVLPVLVIAVRTRQREHGKHRYLVEGLDWTVQTYRTNDMDSHPNDRAWDDDGRSGIGPLIAERKTAWGIGKFPCSIFLANAASLMLKLLSHNLVRRYVHERAPKLRGWRTSWVRRTLFLVPGRLTRTGRRRRIRMQPRPALEQSQLE